MRGDHARDLLRRVRLEAKYQRLQGLRDLYATYEQAGHQPHPGSYMAELSKRIYSTQTQLNTMTGSWEAEAPLP